MDIDNKTMELLTAEELLVRGQQAPAVILPVASIEILGKHGPVGLDWLVADYVSKAVAEKTACLAAPTIPYGDTMEFGKLPGTVHIPTRTLEDYLYAVARSFLTNCGLSAVVFLCTHSLNTFATGNICRRLTEEGYEAAIVDWWQVVGSVSQDILEDKGEGRGHGSEMITSVALALCPEGVHMDRAVPEKSKERLGRINSWNGTPFRLFGNFAQYCESGAWGLMTLATKEKGTLLLERGIDAIVAFIQTAFQK